MTSLYRKLPKVDELLEEDYVKELIEKNSRKIVVEAIRAVLDDLRALIQEGIDGKEFDDQLLMLDKRIEAKVNKDLAHHLIKCINGTGIVLHTNLGRSPFTKEIMDEISKVACGYSNLEYNLDEGQRGERYSHIEEILKEITGAEAAMLVNNNASAVMLILSSLAKGKEVITSRGELIEIGGSFRIPAVCELSGADLVEVGTTNKTHLSDYEEAINENTGAILKVHTSNYKILGFTEAVSAKDMLELKENNDIYIIEDLGSGVLIDLSKYGLDYEPTVQDSIRNGVDVVSFSGDKLLGGPQAGIIVGKKAIIDKLKKNQMTRALRVDKLTISSLETILRYYLDEKVAIKKIPTLRMLTYSKEELHEKAEALYNMMDGVNDKLDLEIIAIEGQVGGGSLPTEKLPGYGIAISSSIISDDQIEKQLRSWKTPIIVRLADGRAIVDVRTIFEDEFDEIVEAIKHLG